MFIFLYDPDDVIMGNEELSWQDLPKGCFQTNVNLTAVSGESLSGIYFHAGTDQNERPKSGSQFLGAFRHRDKSHLFDVTLTYEFGIASRISVWRAELKLKKRIKTW